MDIYNALSSFMNISTHFYRIKLTRCSLEHECKNEESFSPKDVDDVVLFNYEINNSIGTTPRLHRMNARQLMNSVFFVFFFVHEYTAV